MKNCFKVKVLPSADSGMITASIS